MKKKKGKKKKKTKADQSSIKVTSLDKICSFPHPP